MDSRGGDDTFGSFPEHLRALLDHALPLVDVKAITYPKFETRGELKECVERFREWLQNKVIDLEVAHNAPSPMIDPSVHVVLVGHSMGGIVAAETLLLVASDHPIPSSATATNTTFSANATATPVDTDSTPLQTSMFPQIVGLLAFDTPFLGLSPGVIAHGAEGHYKTASSAYTAFNDISSAFGWNSSKTSPVAASVPKALPPASTTGAAAVDAAATPKWQSWGKYAMFAGAAGAVAAGGAAALYSQRERLSSGWGWVSGHLEFVGCLVRGEELRTRIENVGRLSEVGAQAHGHIQGGGTGFRGAMVLYTVLGRGANTATDSLSGKVIDAKRTFVKLPTTNAGPGQKTIENTPEKHPGLTWHFNINDKAPDEISAHVAMFFPRDNPGFYTLGENATEAISGWVLKNREWYESSESLGDDNSHREGAGTAQSGTSRPRQSTDGGDDGWENPISYDESPQTNHTEKSTKVIKPVAPDPDQDPVSPVWVHAKDLDDTDVWMRDDDGGEAGAEGEGEKSLQSSVVVEKS